MPSFPPGRRPPGRRPPGRRSCSGAGPARSAAAAFACLALAALFAPAPAAAAPVAGTTVAPLTRPAPPFSPIVEPFDPGHPARAVKLPTSCRRPTTTLAIEQCTDGATEDLDAEIDKARLQSYEGAGPAGRAAINRDDRSWLAARGPVCQSAYRSGGTIDVVDIAICLRDESRARLDALKGLARAVPTVPVSDDVSAPPAFYTTAAGSRLGMTSVQGDQSGGGIDQWTVVGGYLGFTVVPKDFPYVDGSFRVSGSLLRGEAGVAGHKVAPGRLYTFQLDYEHLDRDPGNGRHGGWDYQPRGVTVARFG